MAKKRMFTMDILDSDAFLDMPLSAQCLYFHLNMRADDDGFISNPKRIARLINASDDDIRLLIAKRFVLVVNDDGVIVIKHWRMHNTIKSDRYIPTVYQEEMNNLYLKDNKAYTFDKPMETKCFQNVSTVLDIDIGIDKDIDIDIDSNKTAPAKKFIKPSIEEVRTYINDNNLNVDAEYWFDYYNSNGWFVGRTKMKDWKSTLRNWSRREKGNSNKANKYSFNAEEELKTEEANIDELKKNLFGGNDE